MTDDADLFGHTPAQASLFGEGEGRMRPPQPSMLPDPDEVRQRLRSILAKARAAERMPWSERDVRMWRIVFPNMSKWLPEEEAEQLCFAFEQELERLKNAA